jgi:hypothetical protein
MALATTLLQLHGYPTDGDRLALLLSWMVAAIRTTTGDPRRTLCGYWKRNLLVVGYANMRFVGHCSLGIVGDSIWTFWGLMGV